MYLAKDIVLYSIKQVGVFLLPNPSQGYPQHTIHWKAQLCGEMHCEGKKATLLSTVYHQYCITQWSVSKGYTSQQRVKKTNHRFTHVNFLMLLQKLVCSHSSCLVIS